ncbi:hypothetical protein ACFSHT_29105 [Paraburkholderia silviterrae]|uniref:Uncharacterized protein n=1 Tax=Paraburkholderia silviterrae TaxID=2528715 RepID=A0A4R5M595_9BURK|nr:hypothetical protein [Paraburkholderia silviterrae]TDG21118.1 hypothetical protein EYW47_22350 [Paraburkholderia silviterrae]
MKLDQERKILESLYDRIYDALTYVPGGGKTGDFDSATTLLQMTKNYVLNPNDFRNARSSINPNGDLRSAFAFSDMVDAIPEVQAEYAESGRKVSKTYKDIVDAANAVQTEDPAQRAVYDKAYAFLNTKTSIPNFDGPPTETFGPSPIALAYDQNQTAYVNAIGGYRLAYNGYDLDKIEDQRKFQAVAPGLQNTIDQAWNRWVREGKQNVEKASNALRTTINNAVSAAIAQAQDAMSNQNMAADQTSGGNTWFASYAMPTNWCEPACQGTQLTLSSKSLSTSTSERASEYSSHSDGIFWWSRAAQSGSDKTDSATLEASEFELTAELIVVRIRRPWLNSMLFSMTGWSLTDQKPDSISNGQLKGNSTGLLPLIPVAFIVAKNVSIKANFTEQDTSRFNSESSLSESRGWGWGPFSCAGNYRKEKKSGEAFKSTFSNGVLKLPGMQVIAWISSVTPASPPAPASR